ncbi:hypothetical protein DYB35_002642 [Aphanomyces astaci]|uniref:Uncharacterized protein n=1 Tax=Aphanomyces astaci TaxID=112090 RepID=A0A418D054_APHAT|nr:hypothetical protein DYB35_002642 [Aphanomyces astaci]
MEGLLLSVKHFPAALSAQAIETLLKHVGATQIRVLTNRTQNDGKKKRKPDATFVQEHDDDDMPVGSMSVKQRRVLDSGPRSVAAINLPPPLPPTTAASPSAHHHPSAQVAASTELPSLPTPPVVVAAPLKILPQKPRKPDSALATIFEADTTSTATKLVPRPGVISDAELTRTRLSSEGTHRCCW